MNAPERQRAWCGPALAMQADARRTLDILCESDMPGMRARICDRARQCVLVAMVRGHIEPLDAYQARRRADAGEWR